MEAGTAEEPANLSGAIASNSGSAKKAKMPTYSQMVVDAVITLNEKEGSSLKAIRKYILSQYDVKKQDASFNNLTLKAVNRAVASNELEKCKHSFKLSTAEKDKRKEAEKRALQALRKSLEPQVRSLCNLTQIYCRFRYF